jgi:hypothetical protein
MSTKWLDDLQDKIANCWEWHSPALQIGLRIAEPDQDDSNRRGATKGAASAQNAPWPDLSPVSSTAVNHHRHAWGLLE